MLGNGEVTLSNSSSEGRFVNLFAYFINTESNKQVTCSAATSNSVETIINVVHSLVSVKRERWGARANVGLRVQGNVSRIRKPTTSHVTTFFWKA